MDYFGVLNTAHDAVLGEVLEASINDLDASEAVLFLVNREKEELYFHARRGQGEVDNIPLRVCLKENRSLHHQLLGEFTGSCTFQGALFWETTGAAQVCCCALVEANQAFGVLAVIRGAVAFSEEEERSLARLAGDASTRLFQSIAAKHAQQRAEVLSQFHRVSQELLLLEGDKSDLHRVIVTEARKMLGADFVVLYEYDEKKERVNVPASFDGTVFYPDMLHHEESRSRASIVLKLVKNKAPFYASIAGTDWVEKAGYMQESPGVNFFTREKIVSSAGIPLIAKDKVVGVLFLNYRSFRPFIREERDRIGLFAHMTALALLKDRFVREQKRSVDQLRVLNKLGEKLNKVVGTEEDVFAIVHKQTKKLMNADNFYVALWDDAHEKISFPYAVEHGQRLSKVGDAYQPRKMSGGLTEYVLRKKEVLRLSGNDEAWGRKHKIKLIGKPSQSWLGVPLIAEETVLGMIGVQHYDEKNVYDKSDEKVLETIATQLAAVLAQRRLMEQARLKHEELELLREAELAISSRRTLRERLDTIVGNASKLLRAQGGKLYRIDEENKLLILKAWHGISDSELSPDTELAFGEGLSGQIVAQGKPQFHNDYANYAHRVGRLKAMFRALLGVPLRLGKGEKIFGVLTVFDIDSGRDFSAVDIPVLERFARYAALAIRDAEDLDMVHRQLKRLNTVNRVTRAISSKQDIDAYLNEIAVTIKHELRCDQCTVLMREEVNGQVMLVERAGEGNTSSAKHNVAFGLDEGLASLVFRSGVAEIFPDAQKHTAFAALPGRPYRFRSMLISPIQLGNKCMGVVCVDDSRYGWFKQSDLEWVETLALNIAIALQISLASDTQQALSKKLLSALSINENGRVIGIQNIMHEIASKALELTHGSSCVIYLLSENKESIIETYLPPGNEEYHPPPRIKQNGSFSGLTGWIVAQKQPIFIPDVTRDERVNPELRSRIKSMVGFPLEVDSEVIGVLYVNHIEPHDRIALEERFLSMLSDIAALALKKHALLRRMMRARNAARTVAGQALVQDWSKTLMSLVIGAREALQCDAAVVIPYDHEREEFDEPVFDGVKFRHKVNTTRSREGHTSGHHRMLEHEDNMHIALDVLNDRLLSGDFVRREQIKSSVAVRLEVRENTQTRIVGVMFFNYRTEKREIGTWEKEDIQLFANLVANTIRSAQVYRKLDRIRETARTFANENLSVKEDLKRLLDSVAIGIRDTLGCDLVMLHQYSLEEQKFLQKHASAGNKYPAPKRKKGEKDEPRLLYKVLEHEGLLTTNDGMHQELLTGDFSEREGVRATAAMPLGIGEEKVGVLLVSYRRKHRFSEDEKKDIKLFGDQSAVAIRNAQLFQSKQRETKKYETLLRNSPNAVIAVNRKGFVTYCNSKLQDILGYSEDELKKMHVDDLYWENREGASAVSRKLVEHGHVHRISIFARDKTGHRIPILLSAAQLYDTRDAAAEVFSIGILEDQRLVGIEGRVGQLLDLIQEVDRQESLEEMGETIFLHCFELFGAYAGCFMVKRDDKFELLAEVNGSRVLREDGKIERDASLLVRKAHLEKPYVFTDFPPAGDPYLPFSSSSRSAVIIPFVREKEPLGLMYLENKGPRYFHEGDDLLPVLATQVSLALTRAELTRRKESWEKTKERLFESSKSIVAGQIASSFLHEVKNSLNTIIVNARWVKQKVKKESGIQKKAEYLEKIDAIEKGVRRSAKLASDSQRFKVHLVANKKKEYLNEVVDDTIKLIEPALFKKRIKHDFVRDESLDKPAHGKGNPVCLDRGLIELVLINLVMNAIEASPERSKIVFKTKRRQGHVEVMVIDHGHGIEQEDLPEIFKPFFTRKKQTGVGLGLYICKLIVEDKHDGAVDVISNAGKTVFNVRLPTSKS